MSEAASYVNEYLPRLMVEVKKDGDAKLEAHIDAFITRQTI